jgi:hypothetical protein
MELIMTLHVAIATPPGEPTLYRDLTEEELTAYNTRQEAYEANKLDDLKGFKVVQVKSEARRRIIALYNEDSQRNALSEAIELLAGKIETLSSVILSKNLDPNYFMTAEESEALENINTEFSTPRSIKQQIEDLRVKSNEIEASLDPMDYEQLKALDVTNNDLWV